MAFCLLPGLLLQPLLVQAESPTEMTMATADAPKIDPALAKALAAYDANHEVANLQDAADDAARDDGEPLPDPAAAQAHARVKLASWIAILARFKRDIDPDFDPNNPPPVRITPPGEAGLQYPAGVNPADVSDPKLRREYVVPIEKNRERLARFGETVKLSEARATIVERADSSLQDAVQTLGLPDKEVIGTLDKADIAPGDRDALRAAVR